ncbi:ribonuclease H-like domain-containing protein [Tanacetum coccineum]
MKDFKNSNTSDKGTMFGDGDDWVGMQLRSSPKVSTSSPLVSLSSIINMPQELYSIDVAATFGVLLTTVGDMQKLINDIDAGKHDELLSELTPIVMDHPLKNMVDRCIFDSGCSGQKWIFEEFNRGSVTFGGSKGYITGKGKIRVGNLDFDSVSFIKEPGHFNLFSISQICDKKHKVLFTETECLVVSSDFKLPDENQIPLKVPRHHNMYSFDMKTPSLIKDYACLIAKATCDESKLWHRRLGHINFKNLNKLVKGNLVTGLPSKHIEIRHHFIRDCYEKKLISVEKIHTDLNVADLLTKPFDGPRFNF